MRDTIGVTMPFTEFETARIEAVMSDFMTKRAPPPGGNP